MKVRNRIPRLLAAILIAAGLFTLQGHRANADDLATIKQRGTLIVGVKADYPPFGFRSPTGEIVGIEPDLAAAVAKSLGVQLNLVPVTASNRIQFLQQGKIDLVIATMNGTLARRWAVDTVKPSYYAAGFNVMVPKSMILKSWAELKDKPVCGIKDAYYNYEAAMNFKLKVTTFASPAEALTALQQGNCVGLLFDDTWIEGELQQSDANTYDMPLEFKGGTALGSRRAKGSAGMGCVPVRHGQAVVEGRHHPGPRDQVSYQAFEVCRGCAPEGVRIAQQLDADAAVPKLCAVAMQRLAAAAHSGVALPRNMPRPSGDRRRRQSYLRHGAARSVHRPCRTAARAPLIQVNGKRHPPAYRSINTPPSPSGATHQ